MVPDTDINEVEMDKNKICMRERQKILKKVKN